MKNIEAVKTTLMCDNPKCDWENKSVSPENYKDWLNVLCPKCGNNLLTEEDYSNFEKMNLVIQLMNLMSPEEIKEISNSCNMEELINSSFLRDAKNKELVFSNKSEQLDVKISTHKEVKVTELKKVLKV